MKPLRLKNMIAGCLLAAGALPVWGQSGAPTLVIRIDDLGALHSVNEACIQTYRSGIARSVEVMPVAAWYPEAIKMLKENSGLDVGLHLVTVRGKERSFYPFVFAVHVFQYAFSQCDGSAAGCIQFMDMMSLAHGDVITGELIHYFCQILVDR